jgi:hypothetical protein
MLRHWLWNSLKSFRKLRVFGKRALGSAFESKREEVAGGRRK